jgi:hypothetical protein
MAEVVAGSNAEAARLISEILQAGAQLRSTRTVAPESNDYNNFRAALRSLDTAVRETGIYLDKLKHAPGDSAEEVRLAGLWSEASLAIATFDPKLSKRCIIKAEGWARPEVWSDPEYTKFGISIDQMRQARHDFVEEHYERSIQAPPWFAVAGGSFAVVTFASLSYLLFGPNLPSDKRIIFNVWLAFCVSCSAAFLGGKASAEGKLGIPFLNNEPIKFSAVGGISVFIIVLILMAGLNR